MTEIVAKTPTVRPARFSKTFNEMKVVSLSIRPSRIRAVLHPYDAVTGEILDTGTAVISIRDFRDPALKEALDNLNQVIGKLYNPPKTQRE